MPTAESPALAYFVQEAAGIFLCVKHERIGFWRFPVSADKALDLAGEAVRMALVELRKVK